MRQYVYTLLVIIEIQVIWTIHKTLSQSFVPYRGLINSNDKLAFEKWLSENMVSVPYRGLIKSNEVSDNDTTPADNKGFHPLSGINKI